MACPIQALPSSLQHNVITNRDGQRLLKHTSESKQTSQNVPNFRLVHPKLLKTPSGPVQNISNFRLVNPEILNKMMDHGQNISNVKEKSNLLKEQIPLKSPKVRNNLIKTECLDSTSQGNSQNHLPFVVRPPPPIFPHPDMFKNPPPLSQTLPEYVLNSQEHLRKHSESNQIPHNLMNSTSNHQTLMDIPQNLTNLPPPIQPDIQSTLGNHHHLLQQNSDQQTDYQTYHKNQLSQITDIMANMSPKNTQNVINSVVAHPVHLPTKGE